MGDLVSLLITTAIRVVGWGGAIATWRGDRRSFYVRHPEPPPWYPFGKILYRASARGIALGAMLVTVIWVGTIAEIVLPDDLDTERAVGLVLVILALVGGALVGLTGHPRWLVPPYLRPNRVARRRASWRSPE